MKQVDALAKLWDWMNSELNDQDKEFIESVKKEVGPYTKIKILEELLSHYKAVADRIVEKAIPDLLNDAGVSEVTTESGYKVKLQEFYSFKKNEYAIPWLFQHGLGDIVKNEIQVGTGAVPDEVLDALDHAGVDYTVKQEVHPMTLKSALCEYIEKGGVIPSEAFEVNVFAKAKIK